MNSNGTDDSTCHAITLGIAGGSGSGKVRLIPLESRYQSGVVDLICWIFVRLQTTLATALYEALGGDAHVTHLLHDNYYKGK